VGIASQTTTGDVHIVLGREVKGIPSLGLLTGRYLHCTPNWEWGWYLYDSASSEFLLYLKCSSISVPLPELGSCRKTNLLYLECASSGHLIGKFPFCMGELVYCMGGGHNVFESVEGGGSVDLES
jgi:hypothetical protein